MRNLRVLNLLGAITREALITSALSSAEYAQELGMAAK